MSTEYRTISAEEAKRYWQSPMIRFLKPYRGAEVGSVATTIDYGACDMYVRRGIAEWIRPAKQNKKRQEEPSTSPS